MTKRKRKTIQWPKVKDVIVLSVFSSWSLYCLSFPLGHCIVCLFLLVIVLSVFSSWSLYCLSFPLCHCIVCLPLGHCIVCLLLLGIVTMPKRETDNTMTKRKRQTIQWPRGSNRQYNDQEEKTDNTMPKRKRQTIQWPRGKDRQYCLFLLVIVLYVFSSWSLYCMSFPLCHCIVCLFLLVFVLSVFSSWWPRGKDRQHNDQEEKMNNTMTKR
jgi:hypothetical protein